MDRNGARKTFKMVLAEVKAGNVARLRGRAVTANRLAKKLTGSNRAKAYALKATLVGRLVELGVATLSEIKGYESFPVVGFWFPPAGGGLHVPFQQLPPAAKTVVAMQAGQLLGQAMAA